LFAGRTVSAVFGTLALAMTVWLWPCLTGALQPRRAPFTGALKGLSADVLPKEMGSFERIDFGVEHRSGSSDFGEYSSYWTYRLGAHRVIVGVDFPFYNWHELTNCYRNVGWRATSRVGTPDGPGVRVEADLDRPPGKIGLLVFSLVGVDGRPLIDAIPPDTISGVFDRVAVWREDKRRQLRDRYVNRPSYQVQVLVEADRELTDDERKAVEEFYLEMRRRLVEQVAATAKPAAAAPASTPEVGS
jgi:hypothetical protein